MTPRSLGGGNAAVVVPEVLSRTVAGARARETCASCCAIQREMLEDGASAAPQTCAMCGAEYLYRAPTTPAVVRARAPRPIGIGPRPEVQVTAFVRAVLERHLAQTRAESTTTSGRYVVRLGESSTASAMRAAETGIVGSGCSGTKGAWGGGVSEPVEAQPAHVDPESERRWRCIDQSSRETAGAIVVDGHGDCLATVPHGDGVLMVRGVPYEFTLEQRVGLLLADEVTRRRWNKHAAARDTGPMLVGSAELGATRLRAAAGAWWGA